jgi:hypothetical protein
VKKTPILSALLLTAGCWQPYLDWEVIDIPGRPPMVAIQCERQASCLRTAAALCRHGFDILGSGLQVERNHVAQALENYSASVGKRPAADYARVDATMTVQCLEPRPEPPMVTVTPSQPGRKPDNYGSGL